MAVLLPRLRASLILALALLLVASLLGNLWLGWRLREDGGRQLNLHFASVDQLVVLRSKGGLLEVSRIRSPETFSARRPHDLLGLDLGATVTQIRVPAVFRYHVELAPEWRLRIRSDGSVLVIAPAVKPSLPVAIDTAKLERHAEGRWSFFTGTTELDALQRTLTETLAVKAASPSYIAFQRDAARQTVAEFVRKWLLTQARWQHLRDAKVQVLFADEPIERLPETGPAVWADAR